MRSYDVRLSVGRRRCRGFVTRGLSMADAENITLGLFGRTSFRAKFGLGGGRFAEGDCGGVRLVAVCGGVCSGCACGSPGLGSSGAPRPRDMSRGGGGRVGLRRALRAVVVKRGGVPGGLGARWRSSRGSGGRWVALALANLGRSQSGTGRLGRMGAIPRSVCSPSNFARPSLHTTAPVPSRRTSAGRVVMPYNAMRASPLGPAPST